MRIVHTAPAVVRPPDARPATPARRVVAGAVDVFEPAPAKPAPKKPHGSRLEIATYNVLFKTNNTQTRADLTRLMKRNGVINLQEFDRSHWPLLKWAHAQGWGHRTNKGPGQEPILWDRSKYKLLDSGARKLNEPVELHGRRYPARSATWVRLKDRETGKVFSSVSVHTIAHGRGPKLTPRIDAVSKQQFRALAALSRQLSKHGPVIVAGDLNSNPQRNTWPGQILKEAHLRSNWQQLGRDGVKGGTHGAAIIDHLLTLTTMKKKLELKRHRIVHGLHSDHNAVEADYRLR